MIKPPREKFLPFSQPSIGPEEVEEVCKTLVTLWLTTGPKTRRFEELFQDYVGSRHAVAMSSATAGLHASLIAAGVGPGDEVITSPMTFCATANVIVHCGARPVFADVGEDLNLDPGCVERKVTTRTKAIIPVHHGGLPCEMDALIDIARRDGLTVIEDAAHALPARDYLRCHRRARR
ncbi:MAG: DegT/DnrJ/EryC1/StrS family aminotransferase, partial [Candidatus Binatia bacterium]